MPLKRLWTITPISIYWKKLLLTKRFVISSCPGVIQNSYWHLKELQKYNRKLFLCPPQNTQPTLMLFFMINLSFVTSKRKTSTSAFRKIGLLLINNIYFIFCSLEIQERLRQTKLYYNLYTLSERKRLPNLQKSQLQKAFSPVCLLLAQLASQNICYSMW